MLTQKKPKKTSRYTKIGKLALVFFGFLKFPNWHWFFFGFFWLFLAFFGIGFGQNSKLETGFFCFFLGFFGFFWHKLWPSFEIGNWFLGFFGFFLVFFGFFWDFLVFFGI